jgi:hypothetical protein
LKVAQVSIEEFDDTKTTVPRPSRKGALLDIRLAGRLRRWVRVSSRVARRCLSDDDGGGIGVGTAGVFR